MADTSNTVGPGQSATPGTAPTVGPTVGTPAVNLPYYRTPMAVNWKSIVVLILILAASQVLAMWVASKVLK